MVDTNLMMELENKDGEIWVNSQDVAENFGRRHCDLLRAINDLKADLSTPQFCVLFKNGEYIAANGKKNKMYFMTRDGLKAVEETNNHSPILAFYMIVSYLFPRFYLKFVENSVIFSRIP